MRSMFIGILFIAAVTLLAVLSHRRSRLENKIYKHVPLDNWLNVSVFPFLLFLGWFFLVKNILSRTRYDIFPLEDFDILALTTVFMVYAFVGNGIHFTAKILWRYLERDRRTMSYKVNEMFHGRLSHYLIYINSLIIIFLLPVLEINHPLESNLSNAYMVLLIAAGVIAGISCSKAIFYTNEWFGGYYKPLFFHVSALSILMVIMTRMYQLNYSLYPVNVFVRSIFITFIVTFIARQVLIFTRLGTKRRMRFMAKILSV